MLQDGRLPHALMFTDLKAVAIPPCFAFVQYLFCQDKQAHDSWSLVRLV